MVPTWHDCLQQDARDGTTTMRAATDDEVTAGLKAMADNLATQETNAQHAYTRACALHEEGCRLLEHHRRKTAA